MQVSFNGHAYLFVNPKYKGKNISPADAAGRLIYYGGDRIWPLPEGNHDEQHWAVASTPLDDDPYTFTILSENALCAVRLVGPPDPTTGLLYMREISLGSNSPEIFFHALMKNVTAHSVTWSVQSVSPYSLSGQNDSLQSNYDFWAFTPVNTHSSYLNGFHIRDGLASDPSYSVKDGLFRLHWTRLESEVWVDSIAGWLAVVDGASQYAMVEKTKYIGGSTYPGKATMIFFKNGPMLQIDGQGIPYLASKGLSNPPYFVEAELNSPMVDLAPAETYEMDTTWFPSRMGRDFTAMTDAGLVGQPLTATVAAEGLELSGNFGVFFPGKLVAYLYNDGGRKISEVSVESVNPQDQVELHQSLAAPKGVARVSLHLIDLNGGDRGSLGEAFVTRVDARTVDW